VQENNQLDPIEQLGVETEPYNTKKGKEEVIQKLQNQIVHIQGAINSQVLGTQNQGVDLETDRTAIYRELISDTVVKYTVSNRYRISQHMHTIDSLKALMDLSTTAVRNGKVNETHIYDILTRLSPIKRNRTRVTMKDLKQWQKTILTISEKGSLGEKAKLEAEQMTQSNKTIEKKSIDLNINKKSIYEQLIESGEVNNLEDVYKLAVRKINNFVIGDKKLHEILTALLSHKIQLSYDSDASIIDLWRYELIQQASNGELGVEAKAQAQEIKENEIDITQSRKSIFTELISDQRNISYNKSYQGRHIEAISSFSDIYNLTLLQFRNLKIGRQPIYRILQSLVNSDIASGSSASKEQLDQLKKLLVESALNGELGDEAKTEAMALNSKKLIYQSLLFKELEWESNERNGAKQKHKEKITDLKKLLNLTAHAIYKGKIDKARLWEKLRQLVGSVATAKPSTREIYLALKQVKQMALNGELGDEAKTEAMELNSKESIYRSLLNKQIIIKHEEGISINNLRGILSLTHTQVKRGKIEGESFLNIFNELTDTKVRCESNPSEVEVALEKLKQMALNGQLGNEVATEAIKLEIETKQNEIKNLLLNITNDLKEKPTDKNNIEFDSLEEYTVGQLLEKYLIDTNGNQFEIQTNINFQVEIKQEAKKSKRLDFVIPKEFTIQKENKQIIEWHPFNKQYYRKELDELKRAGCTKKEAVSSLKGDYVKAREELARKINEPTRIKVFQEHKKNISGLYDYLAEVFLTSSSFPSTNEGFTSEFKQIYQGITDIQEIQKQKKAIGEITYFLLSNNITLAELSDEEVNSLWSKQFLFNGNRNSISLRVRSSQATYRKQGKKESKSNYRRGNLINFYESLGNKQKEQTLRAQIQDLRVELEGIQSTYEEFLNQSQDTNENQSHHTIDCPN